MNEVKLQIGKIVTGNAIQYSISGEVYENNETTKVYLNASFSGLSSMQRVSENYELGI